MIGRTSASPRRAFAVLFPLFSSFLHHLFTGSAPLQDRFEPLLPLCHEGHLCSTAAAACTDIDRHLDAHQHASHITGFESHYEQDDVAAGFGECVYALSWAAGAIDWSRPLSPDTS